MARLMVGRDVIQTLFAILGIEDTHVKRILIDARCDAPIQVTIERFVPVTSVPLEINVKNINE